MGGERLQDDDHDEMVAEAASAGRRGVELQAARRAAVESGGMQRPGSSHRGRAGLSSMGKSKRHMRLPVEEQVEDQFVGAGLD